jgi:formiminotetrahydrofolate cyclodeaminase
MLAGKIIYLADETESSDFPPTTQQVAVGEELKKQGDQFQQEYQQLIAKDVAAFNAMLREKNIPNVMVKTP